MASMETVNLAPFMKKEGAVVGDAPTPEQEESAAQIDDAFRKNGFLFIDGLDVSMDELEKYYEMAGTLFALPDDHKNTKLKPVDQKSNSGYAGPGIEALNSRRTPDLKELYNIPDPKVVEPDFRGCPEGFGDSMTEFWDKMRLASCSFAIACAVALKLPREFFLSALKDFDLSVIRLNYYPPCDYADGKSTGDDVSASIRAGEHTDFGMFTFLYCDGPGLQVKAVDGGEIGGDAGGEKEGWLDVPVPTGTTAIVNTGALLARWTNDVWRATAHRVVVSNPLQAMSHRFSMTCFVQPDANAVVEVHSKFVEPGDEPRYEPTTGSDYLKMKLNEIRPNTA